METLEVARRVLVLALASCTVTVASVAAQDRLFIGTGEIGSAGRFGERIANAPAPVHGLFVDDGRYVVSGTTAIDTRTGRITAVMGGAVQTGDPTGPSLFTYDGQTVSVFRLDTGQLTSLIAARAPTLSAGVSVKYAPVARQAFVFREASGGGPEIAVVAVDTGVVVRTLGGIWSFDYGWGVSPDGHRIVASTSSLLLSPGVSWPDGLVQIDAVSGRLLASRSNELGSGGDLTDDRHFDRYYTLDRFQLKAFDSDLRPLGALAVRSSCAQPSMAVSPHTGRVYVVDSVGGYQFYGQPVPIHHYLTAYDGVTGRFIDSREVTAAAGVPSGSNSCSALPISVLTAPGAPRQFAATVTGQTVALSWTDGGGIVASFVLQVGLAPGQTLATVAVGAASSTTVSGVPPGRYFARMRGVNAFGVSRPSNELSIVVP